MKKTKFMDQDVPASPSISIGNMVLEVPYMSSIINNNLFLDLEIDRHIDKVAIVMAKLSKSVWDNS